jgi:hypothetical protein
MSKIFISYRRGEMKSYSWEEIKAGWARGERPLSL